MIMNKTIPGPPGPYMVKLMMKTPVTSLRSSRTSRAFFVFLLT
jgi:hypothetical protein